jgi:hypothetical protein
MFGGCAQKIPVRSWQRSAGAFAARVFKQNGRGALTSCFKEAALTAINPGRKNKPEQFSGLFSEFLS